MGYELRLKYIDETTGVNLTNEARQLGRQIGELIKKVKQKIADERKSKPRNP